MSDRISLLRRVGSLDVSPEFDGVSKITCIIDDDTQMSVGDDTGYELVMTNPLMTQSRLQVLLTAVRGKQYQPYIAQNALLDPSAEMGDGVSIKDIYSGIYQQKRTFGKLMAANIGAPSEEEIDHEYKYETPQEKKFRREIGDVRASILIKADEIMSQVVKQEDGNTQSFGWSLKSNGWTVSSGNTTVLKVDKDGLEVAGTIKAGTKIGSGSGFTISAKAIYSGMNSFSSTSNGVYIGTDGISLGGGKFKVTSSGALSASSGTFSGNVYAKNIQYGGNYGTFSGAGISSGTISTSQMNSYASGGIGAGYDAQTTWNYAQNQNVGVKIMYARALIGNTLSVGGYQATWQSRSVKGAGGYDITINYLGFSD